MTPAQIATLATYVSGQPPLMQFYADGRDNQVTAALNAAAAPDYWVWRTSVSEEEIVAQPSVDGTTFSWPALIARSVGEQFGWSRMFAVSGAVNPAQPNVRQAFADIFSGSANAAPAQRIHLLAVARRKASVAESRLATGNGTTASPATLTFEGAATDVDALAIGVVLGVR